MFNQQNIFWKCVNNLLFIVIEKLFEVSAFDLKNILFCCLDETRLKNNLLQTSCTILLFIISQKYWYNIYITLFKLEKIRYYTIYPNKDIFLSKNKRYIILIYSNSKCVVNCILFWIILFVLFCFVLIWFLFWILFRRWK